MSLAAIIVLVWTLLLVVFCTLWKRWQDRMVQLDEVRPRVPLVYVDLNKATSNDIHKRYGRKYG